ncbi:MAG: endonuclease/exonuclease/phosphatase [Chitinophagaceae bacterium]
MPNRFVNITKRVLFVLNFLFAFVYLLSCISPFADPARWWFISWLGLAFPFLLAVMIISIFFWVFVKMKYALVFFIASLFGIKNISVFFAFHTPKEFNYQKPDDVLRIASWNVARFVEIKENNNKGSQTRLKMLQLLKEQNADILCLQEFHTALREGFYNNISYIQKELNYPYYYFSFDEDGSQLYYSSIIFSRLPLLDSGKTIFPRPSLPEALLHVDVLFDGDTIRIFTTHLQSFQFKKDDYEKINEIKSYRDSLIENSRTIFSKWKQAATYRSLQAKKLHEQVAASPHPVVLCADFNDVPNSYTYFTARGNLQDAFLKKGFGIGRTFSGLSPTLRIDYILPSSDFSVLQFNRLVKNYSDHYMIVADLKLKTAEK